MNQYSKIELEVQYRGVTESVVILETPRASVMSPTVEEKKVLKLVTRVEQSPGSKETIYYGRTGKEERVEAGIRTFRPGSVGKVIKVYNPDLDPERFIISWLLHNTAFLKDQEIDGLKLSDWCYFDAQVKQLHRSCLWGLLNKLKLSHKDAKKYADKAVYIFKADLIRSRGCNLDEPIKESDRLQDEAIMRNEAMKEFHAAQTNYW